MKNNKIEVGQCYEKDDHVYIVKEHCPSGAWMLYDIVCDKWLSKYEEVLLTLRRPFDNFG